MQNNSPPLFFIVPSSESGQRPGQRLDIFLTDALKSLDSGQQLSRERIKKAVLENRVSLNGQPCLSPKHPIKPGDEIGLTLENTLNQLTPEPGELNVVAQLGDVLVLDKTPDLTMHPCDSQPEGTLVQRLLAAYPQLAEMDGLRPGIVHRLDKDTSGLLLVALSEPVRLALCQDFAERNVHKTYLALVHGVPKFDEGEIEVPIGRHPSMKTRMAVVSENKGGKPALTRWKKIWSEPATTTATKNTARGSSSTPATTASGGRFSLLEIQIITGRTHQVRVHMSHIGHPLLGDKVYGPQRETGCPAPRQMLHAWRLNFTHPQDGKEYTFIAPPPDDFVNAALDCADHPLHLILTGSAGCGKSTVLRLLQESGLPTWSADAVVSRLYEPGQDGWSLLDQRFAGQQVTGPADNQSPGKSERNDKSSNNLGGRFTPRDHNEMPLPVDKQALFAALKETPGLKRDIEELIHPLVKHDLEQFWQDNDHQLPVSEVPALVAEIPLFFESGTLFCPPKQAVGKQSASGQASQPGPLPELFVVTVSCPEKTREQRLKARGLSDEDIAVLSVWQWPEDKKIQCSQAILDNSGTLEELKEQIARLLGNIKSMLSANRDNLKKIITREC